MASTGRSSASQAASNSASACSRGTVEITRYDLELLPFAVVAAELRLAGHVHDWTHGLGGAGASRRGPVVCDESSSAVCPDAVDAERETIAMAAAIACVWMHRVMACRVFSSCTRAASAKYQRSSVGSASHK
jgi:hypothetical protein